MIKKFGIINAKPVNTPMEPGIRLTDPEEMADKNFTAFYRELIGALTCLSITTNCHSQIHWNAAKKILR